MSLSAIVTGASEGIGRAFAKRLAQDGYRLTLVARTEAKLKELVKELGGADHSYQVADLATSEGQEKIMGLVDKNRYNVLINNAGVGTLGGFAEVEYDKQMRMFHLNCEALVKLSYVFLKNSQSGDALINVSSALAFMPTPNMALYCATKSFVTALSDSLWFEQKARGVYVMGLCPGITDTQFQVTAGGRKEDLPKGLTQTPEHVVEVAMSALKQRSQPTVVSGIKNLMFAGMSRLLPRKSIVTMNARMMAKAN